MKAIQFNSSNVITTAVKCMQHDMDEATAVSKVRFCYQKLDGTIRYAVGTLQSDAVKANIEGTGIPKRFFGMFAYLDLQKMQWRGFKIERLIGIVD